MRRAHAGLVALIVLTIAGCGSAPTARPADSVPAASHDPVAPLAGDTTPKQTGEVDRLRHIVADRERELAGARTDLANAEKARDEARKDRLVLIAWWVAGVALLGVFASVALWFLLPAGLKRWGIGGGGACAVVLVAAMTFTAILPYLAWAVGFIVIGGVAWGLWFLARTIEAARQNAAHGDRIESAISEAGDLLPDDVRIAMEKAIGIAKGISARDQVETGVKALIEKLRGKAAG